MFGCRLGRVEMLDKMEQMATPMHMAVRIEM
jgi:hypothetical protein